MRCPQCKTELYKIPVKLDGIEKDVFVHRNTIKKCDYKDNGIRIEPEVTNRLLLDKFQELVKNEGVPDEPEKPLKDTPPLNNPIKKEKSDMVYIKTRLATGELSINEYDEILKRLNETSTKD